MKTYIWSLPTRVFHWLLGITLITAYVLGEEEELLNLHTSFGYAVGILIVFRLFWGIIGPKYSRFRDFPLHPGTVREFIINMKASKQRHVGHNPLASWVMIGIILCSGLISLSGILLLAAKGEPAFSFLRTGISADSLKDVHEALVSIVIALVIVHLLGIIVDFLTNREMGSLVSIFSGYKNIQADPVQLTLFQRLFSAIALAISLLIIPYAATTQNLSLSTEQHEEEHDEQDEEGDD